MNKQELSQFKKKIKEEINSTEILIKNYKNLTKPISPENAIGRVSRMDAINNKSVLEAALRKAEAKLKKLAIVKKEINKPNFGICIRCNQSIPAPRLILIPESKKCVNCA